MIAIGSSGSSPSLQDLLAQLGMQAPNLDGSAPDANIAALLQGAPLSAPQAAPQPAPSADQSAAPMAQRAPAAAAPLADPTADLQAALADPSGFAPAQQQPATLQSVMANLPKPNLLDWWRYGVAAPEKVLGRQAEQAQYAAQILASQQAQMRYQQEQAQYANMSPGDKIAFLTNAPELGKAYASQDEAKVVPDGQSVYVPGQGRVFTAPKMVSDATAGTYGTQTPGAYQQTGVEKVPVIVPAGSVLDTFNGANASGQGAGGVSGSPSGSPPPTPSPALAAMAPNGKLDPTAFFKTFILPHEGGLNPSDMNGSPTNYGINQAANPGVDVSKLTPDQAAGIFASKYFGPSGAANMSPALAAIHADTAFINPAAAQRFLRRSGGDPADYMARRQSWMASMVGNNPAAAKYAKAWAQRNADLSQLAGLTGTDPQASTSGGAPQPAGQPSAPGWSGPPSKTYVHNADGTQTAPTGEITAGPGYIGPKDADARHGQITASKQYAEYAEAKAAYDNIVQNMANPGGMADYAIGDNYVRIQNPGMGAKIGNMEMVNADQGLPDQMAGQLQAVLQHGQHFTPATRALMEQSARIALQSRYNALKPQLDDGMAWAKAHNLNPADVVPSITAPPTNAPQAAQNQSVLAQAQDAIARGAPRAAVLARLSKMGISSAGL